MNDWRNLSHPIPLVAGRILREVCLVAAGLLVYFLVRGSVTERSVQAVQNALAIIDIQKALGFFWEPYLQSWVLNSALQIRFWNWIYFWAHAPAIVVLGLWFLWRHPRTYMVLRNAFLVSALLALICYYVFPVAPPRLVAGYGFVDTMQLYSPVSYQAQSIRPFVNPYAAMPSLHFGWAYLLGAGIYMVWRNARGAMVAILLPVLMGLAIVFTANHYILDGVGGFAVASIGLAAALWWDRGSRRPPRRSMPARRPARANALSG